MTQVGNVLIEHDPDTGLAGLIWARGCKVASAPPGLDQALEGVLSDPPGVAATQKAVRDHLRFGVYKPSGRGKPACEYLLKAAREGRFPRINNLVDINNLISLSTQLPISLVDLGRAQTDRFRIRRGRPDERYVFNQAGQTIELQDLLLVARMPEDEPCANPVKDSMATKLSDASTDVLAVVYGPHDLRDVVQAAAARFAESLSDWGDASEVCYSVGPSGSA